MSYISTWIDPFLKPFEYTDPLWPVMILSLITALIVLLIFRFFSNQEKIRQAKNKMKAHLLELTLFRNDFRILMSAQKNLLINNAKYLTHTLRPLAIIIIPMAILLVPANNWFGYAPIKPGETAIVKIKLTGKAGVQGNNLLFNCSEGISIESPPINIPEDNEINLKIKARKRGNHNLTIKMPDNVLPVPVTVSAKKLVKITPVFMTNIPANNIFYPAEMTVINNPLINKIEILYPERSITFLGTEMHWVVLFLIFTLIFAFSLKNVMKIEI